MILIAAAVVAPLCVGVIGTYVVQQKKAPSEQRQLTINSNSQLSESPMNQAALQSFVPPRVGLLAALSGGIRSMFMRRASTPSQMRVIDTVALGPRDRAFIVEVGESWVIVGQGGNGLSSLATLRKGGAIATDAPKPAPVIETEAGERIDFAERARLTSDEQHAQDATAAASLEQSEALVVHSPDVIPSMTKFLSGGDVSQQPVMFSVEEPVLFEAAPAVEPPAATDAPLLAEAASVAREIPQSVTEIHQLLATATGGAAPASVTRDDDGFPDVVEAVKARSQAEAAADEPVQSVADAVAADGSPKRSFLKMYSEVKNNAA